MKIGSMVVVVKAEPHWRSWVSRMKEIPQQIGTLISYEESYIGTKDRDNLEFIGLVEVEFNHIGYHPTYYLPAHCVKSIEELI